MSKKLLKSSVVIFLISLLMLLFTGCDSSKIQASCQSLRDQFESRATANKNIALSMKDIGLISEDYCNNLNTSIDQHMDELAKKFEIGDDTTKLDFGKDGAYNTVLKSVSAFTLPYQRYLAAYNETTGKGETVIESEDQSADIASYKDSNEAGDISRLNSLFFFGLINETNAKDKNGKSFDLGGKITRTSLFTDEKLNINTDKVEKTYDDPDMPSVDKNLNWVKLKESNVVPYELVSDSINGTETLNDVLKSPIYVLDNSKLNSSNGIDLETMSSTLQELLDNHSDGEIVSRLEANYFKKTDLNLVDTDTVSNVLIAPSQGYDSLNMSELPELVDNNRPGHDLIMTEWGYPLFTIRLKEFNKDAYDEFLEKLELCKDSIKIVRSGNESSAAILLNYPVTTLSELSTSTDGTLTGNLFNPLIKNTDYNGYEPLPTDSYLSVNIYTGEMMKNYITSEGVKSSTVNNEQSYLTINNKKEQTDSSKSSFELTKGSFNYGIKGLKKCSNSSDSYFTAVKKTIEIPEIICKDYLEAVYMPEFVNNEDWVTFGRKIRLINFKAEVDSKTKRAVLKWDLKNNSNIAGYVDINGDFRSDATLQYNEIADIKSYYDSYTEIVPIQTDEETGQQVFSETSLTDKDLNIHLANYQDTLDDIDKQPKNEDGTLKSITGKKIQLEESGTNSAEGIQKLDSWITNEMYASVPFPSKYMDKADYTDSQFKDKQNQMFYAIGTTKTIFENDLYTGWIDKSTTDEDSEKACLQFFIKWLSDNDYKYTISLDNLTTYLKNNYSYEFAKANDVILINPEVVAKLQKDLDEEKSLSQAKKFTSVFKIVGWGLISYSLILIVAWVLDTMVDIGIKLTNKITFGKWEAVRYESDIPSYDSSNIKYISLPQLLKSILIINVLGIILIVVPAMKILAGLLNIFGGIATYFDEVFSNIYK